MHPDNAARVDGFDATLSPFWRRLLHRWLIEYNPLYLVSACLVLAGVSVLSSGLEPGVSLSGGMGLSAIVELYALLLIAAAALLTRFGLRRPAVMLALLAVLYQGDLTLTTEAYAYYSWVGVFPVTLWLGLFVAKLVGLAWALRLAPSRDALAVPVLGALGLALLPRQLAHGDPNSNGALVLVWLFALFASGLWTSRSVSSSVPLDAWGNTVLRRGLRATWVLWSGLVLAHVAFWSSREWFPMEALVPLVGLLATRWARREVALYVWVTLSLLASTPAPGLFPVTSLLAAFVFALHALRTPAARAGRPPQSASPDPYRTPEHAPPQALPEAELFALAPRAVRMRLLSGAVCCAYLSLWTLGGLSDGWPPHQLLLDAALTLAVVLLVWRARVYAAVLPLLATYAHAAVRARWIVVPDTSWKWGATSVALGFTLLIASVGASIWLKRFEERLGGDKAG